MVTTTLKRAPKEPAALQAAEAHGDLTVASPPGLTRPVASRPTPADPGEWAARFEPVCRANEDA